MAGNVHLGKKLENCVDELVRTGRYTSREEVLSEGVRLVERREQQRTAVDRALEAGIADAEAGRVHAADSAFAACASVTRPRPPKGTDEVVITRRPMQISSTSATISLGTTRHARSPSSTNWNGAAG